MVCAPCAACCILLQLELDEGHTLADQLTACACNTRVACCRPSQTVSGACPQRDLPFGAVTVTQSLTVITLFSPVNCERGFWLPRVPTQGPGASCIFLDYLGPPQGCSRSTHAHQQCSLCRVFPACTALGCFYIDLGCPRLFSSTSVGTNLPISAAGYLASTRASCKDCLTEYLRVFSHAPSCVVIDPHRAGACACPCCRAFLQQKQPFVRFDQQLPSTVRHFCLWTPCELWQVPTYGPTCCYSDRVSRHTMVRRVLQSSRHTAVDSM